MTIAEKLTLIAQNEQKVYNAGYEKGKSEGGGGSGGGEQPTLFAPSIELNSVSSVLTITDNKNGAFEVLYDLYAGDNKLATLSSKTATLTDYMEHTETIEIKVQAKGTNFNSSEFSTAEWKYVNVNGTAGLAYTISGTSASCTGIGDAVETDIEIASEYEGVPVTMIGSYAFQNNKNITSVVISEGVQTISSYAFGYCSSLTSITIPGSVTSIEDNAFIGCRGCTSFSVGENNQTYKDIDGNLYSKDGKTLIQYAKGKTSKSFVIPNGVTYIAERAVSECKLYSVSIPESVTSIGNYAFYNGYLRRVDFSNHTSIPTIANSYVFMDNAITFQIKVPADLIDEWKSATNWSTYASKIVTEFTNEV